VLVSVRVQVDGTPHSIASADENPAAGVHCWQAE